MSKHPSPKVRLSRISLALALALGAGATFAQSTTGSIFGQAPAAEGETVVARSANGVSREVTVGADGRYTIGSLPLGSYTVSLMQGGKAVDSRNDVSLRVGSGTEVSFAAGASAESATSLGSVTVSANTLPPVDVSSVDSRTVITSEQLAKLPLARSAEAIALLAPGVVPGYSGFTGTTNVGQTLVSIGGSSVTENAYYLNGVNTTDPLSGFGGISLPYGAIDQQEILGGGYGAAYGRSDGGVISQSGKRGTNEWHFGAQVLWEPAFARGTSPNSYYLTGSKEGQIYRRYSQNNSWSATESAYVGGPLIKDKLFFFAAVEQQKQSANSVQPVTTGLNDKYEYHNPKFYGKIDWNINDNNILELTAAGAKTQYKGNYYDYDYDTGQTGALNSRDTSIKNDARVYIAKYTSYITDDITLTALYGKQKMTYFSETPGYDSSLTYILHPELENPALTGGGTINNGQSALTIDNPDHRATTRNLRLDLSWKIGDHTITGGIDNLDSHDVDDGTNAVAWQYGYGDAGTAISDAPYVAAPNSGAGGETGYYVSKYIYTTSASVRVKQRAQYLEDSWQVDDRWLVKIGLRNDQFTNYNPSGDAYLRLTKPQWAPRLGAAWDVNGDSSLKVYANAGRYYLAMPASVALRAAAGSLYTNEYYTYTGIDANGYPTGLTQLASSTGGAVSANNEYGQSPDAKTVASSNIKSEYQDEFQLGFDHQINTDWVWGMKGQVRRLRNILDDICDTDTIAAKAASLGYDVDAANMNGCYLSNPGRTNTYRISNGAGGYYSVDVSAADFGMPKAKRNYYSLETYLEHPFDGTWTGKIDYLYSKSYGNTEGQVRSDIGQTDVSATVDWDYGKLMEYSNGLLSNDRKHQFKAYGSWQVAKEWMLSGNILIMSGTPKTCLGYYGADETNPVGYGSYYHYCGGEASPPGSAGRQPWQHIISLSAEYRPVWADQKLAFNVMVYNVLNESKATASYALYGTTAAPNTNYGRVTYYSTPRYVRFGITYDF
ncbi:TonB-dependent receptor plug domain-containing protein [Luteibacter aegosomatissinici]|uniref:TonB-dependent receptor plug domain-containing protein n=1 Tax=Luteibacter aegosomatissinici TaxID=2911539 RepID=UPI001FFC1AAD|nr:TonB-dependent receptor plug domain-containing protein [Luteibacter aegosomatissinici]UPG95076.1 TonB-dependent receptor [Luteibacter aegosomatissinici]